MINELLTEPVFAYTTIKSSGGRMQTVYIGNTLEDITKHRRGMEGETDPRKIDLPWYEILRRIQEETLREIRPFVSLLDYFHSQKPQELYFGRESIFGENLREGRE